MMLFEVIMEVLIHGFYGWVGHMFVRVITFGRVRLDYGEDAESAHAEVIGAVVLLVIFIVGGVWIDRLIE